MELICIQCPIGCHLTVTQENNEIVVTGNTCPRGKQYAIQETTDPRRTLTSTVSIVSNEARRLPVISDKPLPKDLLLDASLALKEVCVKAPVNMNDVIIENILDTGCNIIASKTINQ